MPHDFLAGMREPVESDPKPAVPRVVNTGNMPAPDAAHPVADDPRHRTVGVSMSPMLRRRAAARAGAVGLSFSRYVQWCIEAEMEGCPPQARFEQRKKGD
jgi:hypothetical protein